MSDISAGTVLLAAADPERTRAWRRALVDSGRWQALRPAHSVAHVRQRLRMHPADLVISDVQLQDATAVDLVRMLRRDPDTAGVRLLVVSRRPDDGLLDALQEGADGVLDESADRRYGLVDHAQDLMVAGGIDVPAWIARRLLDFFDGSALNRPAYRLPAPSANPATSLSTAQWQLLRNLSIGRRLAEAAAELGLEPPAGTAQVRAIHRKMQQALGNGGLQLQLN